MTTARHLTDEQVASRFRWLAARHRDLATFHAAAARAAGSRDARAYAAALHAIVQATGDLDEGMRREAEAEGITTGAVRH